MASELHVDHPRCRNALMRMPMVFTLKQYREVLGVSFGPDWSEAAAVLKAYARRGFIEPVPNSKRWKRINLLLDAKK